jgi:hypothetical protein
MALFSSACLKQTESIAPIAAPRTLSQLQQDYLMTLANRAGNSELSASARSTLQASTDPSIFYLNIKYNISNIDVFEVINMPNTFEQIGHTFLMRLAKLVLAIGGARQININSFNLAIPDLNLDKNIVKSIRVKRVFLQYNKEVDEASDYAASFSFLESLELARVLNINKIGQVDSLLLSYRRIHNNCLYKCIQFDIVNDNLLDLLEPNSSIKLQPTLAIVGLPAVNNIKLDGLIELQIGLKLPF